MPVRYIAAADLDDTHTIVMNGGQWLPTAINREVDDLILVDVECIDGDVGETRTLRVSPTESMRVLV